MGVPVLTLERADTTVCTAASARGHLQRLGQSHGPVVLSGGVCDLVLTKLHLKVGPSSSDGVKGSGVVHGWVDIVGLVVSHEAVSDRESGYFVLLKA